MLERLDPRDYYRPHPGAPRAITLFISEIVTTVHRKHLTLADVEAQWVREMQQQALEQPQVGEEERP